MKIVSATVQNVESFLEIAGSSLTNFRYFSNRPLSVLRNHFSTFVGIKDSQPVAYGHLDVEDDTMWLGICVADFFCGHGAGKQMMSMLVSSFRGQDRFEDLYLTVDSTNIAAVGLYKSFGFGIIEEYPTYLKMKLKK